MKNDNGARLDQNLDRVDHIFIALSLLGILLFGGAFIYQNEVLRYFNQNSRAGMQAVGEVRRVEHDIRRRLARSLTWYDLSPGETLYQRDGIFSGDHSNVQLTVAKSDVLIEENSLLYIDVENGQLVLNLELGSVSAVVSHPNTLIVRHGEQRTEIKPRGKAVPVHLYKDVGGGVKVMSEVEDLHILRDGQTRSVPRKEVAPLDRVKAQPEHGLVEVPAAQQIPASVKPASPVESPTDLANKAASESKPNVPKDIPAERDTASLPAKAPKPPAPVILPRPKIHRIPAQLENMPDEDGMKEPVVMDVQWTKVPTAMRYQVEALGEKKMVSQNKMPIELYDVGVYDVKVTALNEKGEPISKPASQKMEVKMRAPASKLPVDKVAIVQFKDEKWATPVLFAWSKVPSAQEYEIEFASDAEFANVFKRERVRRPAYLAQESLGQGAVFYWRVRGVRGEYTSGWSNARSFTVSSSNETANKD